MLHYKTYGTGRPFVLLHGLFGMLDNWQTLARRWAEHYEVILLDLPNHGRSPHFDEFSYAHMSEAVAGLLATLGHKEYYLMGHSMGGKVAMQLALDYPDRVSKLVVLDMAPRQYRRGHDSIFAALNAFDPATISSRKEASELMAVHVTDPGIQLFLLKNLNRGGEGGYAWRMNLPVIQAQYDNLIDSVGNFGDCYPGPALFVRGGDSRYVKDDDITYIEMLFPEAELVTIAGASHWVHAEKPDVLFDAVTDFFSPGG